MPENTQRIIIRVLISAQNALIIKLKSCTAFPHVPVYLLVTETQAESQVTAAWEVGAGDREGYKQTWGRSIQFRYNGRKTNSEHIPYKEQGGSLICISAWHWACVSGRQMLNDGSL